MNDCYPEATDLGRTDNNELRRAGQLLSEAARESLCEQQRTTSYWPVVTSDLAQGVMRITTDHADLVRCSPPV